MAAEVSGVNVVYSLIYIVFQFAFGCSSGFSVITSNCAGEKDLKILSYCYNEAKTISEIASFLGVRPSTYFRVNVIERLCKAGYLVENKKTRNYTYISNPDRVFPQASPSDL